MFGYGGIDAMVSANIFSEFPRETENIFHFEENLLFEPSTKPKPNTYPDTKKFFVDASWFR